MAISCCPGLSMNLNKVSQILWYQTIIIHHQKMIGNGQLNFVKIEWQFFNTLVKSTNVNKVPKHKKDDLPLKLNFFQNRITKPIFISLKYLLLQSTLRPAK